MSYALSYIKDVLTVLSLIAAIFAGGTTACVAILGLQTWKKQLKGKQEFDLAKSLLLNTYKYKEALFQVRHPAIWTHEFPNFSLTELAEMSPEEKRYRQFAYAYQQRWNAVIKIKPMLYNDILETQALWDNYLRKIFDKIFKMEFEIQDTISSHLRKVNPATKHENCGIDSKTLHEKLYDKLDEKDYFRLGLNPLFIEIENYLKPKLKL